MSAATKKVPKVAPPAGATLDPHLERIRALATKLLDEESTDADQQLAARLLTAGDITIVDTLRVAHDHLRASASNRIAESGFCEPLVGELMIDVRDWLDLTFDLEFNDGRWRREGKVLAPDSPAPGGGRQFGPNDWATIQRLAAMVRNALSGSTPPGEGWVGAEIVGQARADEVGAIRLAHRMIVEEVRYQVEHGGADALTDALARVLNTYLWDAGSVDREATKGGAPAPTPPPEATKAEEARLTLEEHRDRARDLAWEVEALAWTLFRWIDSTIEAEFSLREREHLQSLLRVMRDRTAQLSVHAGEGSG